MLDNNKNINNDTLSDGKNVQELPVEEVEAKDTKQEDFDELDEFVPRKPEPHTWPVSTKRFYLSGKDKVYITVLLGLIALFAAITVCVFIWANSSRGTNDPADTTASATQSGETHDPEETLSSEIDFVPAGIADDVTSIPSELISSTNAVFLDLSTNTVTASRLADERTYPASLTKVMTLIVAVENLKNASALDDVITVSEEVFNKMRAEGASGAGLEPGEKLTVESMLYALILESDGIAACELAKYVAGSEEAFVQLMNDKALSIGLEDTHFVNPTGLHDNDHYSTCRDLANIMAYAVKNEFCKKIMETKSYTAVCTQPSGRQFNYYFYHSLLVTQFDKFQKTQPQYAVVMSGKTGYTPESGYCLVTYAQNENGGYIAVTTGAGSYSDCISDYIVIYDEYIA